MSIRKYIVINSKIYNGYCGIKDDEIIKCRLQIKEGIEELNLKYNDEIADVFHMYGTSKIRGIIDSSEVLFGVIKKMESICIPLTLLHGLSIEKIDLENRNYCNSHDDYYMNPDHYLAANSAERKLNLCKNKKMNPETNISIIIRDDRELGNNIDTLAALRYNIEKKWTKNQKNAVDLYRKLKCNQRAVGEELKISQSAVCKRLNAANYYLHAKTETCIINMMRRYIKSMD